MLYLVLKKYTLFLLSEFQFLSETLGVHIWANPHVYFNFVLYTYRSPPGIQAPVLFERGNLFQKRSHSVLKEP